MYRTIFVYHVVNRRYLSKMSYPEKNTPSLVYVRPVRMECLEFDTMTKPLIYYPKPYGARNRIHPLTEKEREHRVREIEKQGGWIEEEEEDGRQH